MQKVPRQNIAENIVKKYRKVNITEKTIEKISQKYLFPYLHCIKLIHFIGVVDVLFYLLPSYIPLLFH